MVSPHSGVRRRGVCTLGVAAAAAGSVIDGMKFQVDVPSGPSAHITQRITNQLNSIRAKALQ